MTIFYFTSTGNSLYVAKRIGGTLVSIPQALKETSKHYQNDVIGFVFPCYGWGIPNIVQHFIKATKFEAEYFFAVMTYGNIPAGGLWHMEKIAEKVGLGFHYTAEILMVDNYLPVYKMERQLEKEPGKKIEEQIAVITSDISNRANRKVTKGIGATMASAVMQKMYRLRRGDVDKKFYINDACTNCKICQKVCPKGNIELKEGPVYLHKCDYCMGCINLCPQNAIHLKGQRSTARFRNRHVSLDEIIVANEQ